MKQAIKIISILMISSVFLGWAQSWQSIKKTAQTIKTVKADFVQEKHMKILRKPLISRGSFYYKAAHSLRWEYTSPVKSILLMDDNKISRYVQGEHGYIKDSSSQIQSMQVVLREITMWFKGEFNANPDFHAALMGGNKVVLTPKNQAMKKIIQKIVLVMAKKPGAIQMVTIYETQTNFTVLRFANVALNLKLNDSIFRKM